jgi:hypothetical protein
MQQGSTMSTPIADDRSRGGSSSNSDLGDFENLAEILATVVTLASSQLALRRLARALVANATKYRFGMGDGGGPQRVGERTFAGTRGNG